MIGNKEVVRGALEASGTFIASVIDSAEQAGGKVKGFECGVILNQTGHKLDQKVSDAMWERERL